MKKQTKKNQMKNKKIARNRWFIWTIVFLIVVGVTLVTWIMDDQGSMGLYGTVVHHNRSLPR